MNRQIRNIRSKGLQLVRWLLSFLIPVERGKIIFDSYPDYSDNARAFSDYLLRFSNYKLTWAVSDVKLYKSDERIRFIKRDGNHSLLGRLKYIKETVSSEYLISTHGAFTFANKRRQKYVCCWHGMPLKRIAIWQNPKENKNFINNASNILSTSKFYVPILAKCFGRDEIDILPIGYPRNDWLYEDSDVLDKMGIILSAGEKLIMYLPTFRKTYDGSYVDATNDVFHQGPIDFGSDKVLKELDDYLRSINVKLIVKPHPLESNQLAIKRYNNLLVIPHNFFLENDIQLNKVLHYADAIITDFSGAFVDFLNLNRPIGFVLSDISEYKQNRGFVFENPLDYMPGQRILSKVDFESFCCDISKGVDNFKEEREAILHVFSDFQDNSNCKRFAEYLKLDIFNKQDEV